VTVIVVLTYRCAPNVIKIGSRVHLQTPITVECSLPNMQQTLLQFTTLAYIKSSAI